MNLSPLVSLIITNYNRAGMVERAILSALDQDYPNLEIVISDNLSTDCSDEVIKKYLSDSRVVYNRNKENIGMINNFRRATYEIAKGDYITYVNSDDYLVNKSFISEAIDIINRHGKMDLVFGRMGFDSTTNNVLWQTPEKPYFIRETWDGKEVFFKSTQTWLFSWGACLMKKSAMMSVRAIAEDYHNIDFDSNYKIMLNSEVGFVNSLCYMQVGHEENAGFPINSDKIIHSLKCFENIANYGIEQYPQLEKEFNKWKDHFILFTIKIAFHSLIEKNKVEYKKFKREVKAIYPKLYSVQISSWSYKRMILLYPVKLLVSPKMRARIRKVFIK